MKNKLIILLLSVFLFSDSVNFDSANFLNYRENKVESAILDETINPDNYIVGPGDVFNFVMITSNEVINRKLTVSPLGDIIIPVIGKIDVDKLSLSSAFTLIEKQCKNKIKNSSIDITLSKIKNFKILVLGPKNIKTGHYSVKSSTRLLDIFNDILFLGDSDTLNQNLAISSRNIIITQSDRIKKDYDLLQYRIDGNGDNNPYLNPGDIIELSYIKEYINIDGAVMVPGKYEYKNNENLFSLINICGGYQVNADLNNIEITRYTNDIDKEIIYLKSDMTDDFILMPYDKVLIKPNTDYKREQNITIEGEVVNPGIYSIYDNTTIKDIILRSGGYSIYADTDKIVINNQSIDRLGDKELNRILALNPDDRSDLDHSYIRARARSKRGAFSNSDFNLSNNVISDYKLFNKDKIYIPAKYDFIEIIGAVRNPGRYPFKKDLDVKSYIQEAGGVTKNATKSYFIIQASTGDRLSAKSFKYNLKSQDIIFVEEKNDYNDWERFKDIVELSSQVLTIFAIINNLSK